MYRRAVPVGVLSSAVALLGFVPAAAHAQEEGSLDERINDAVSPVTDRFVEIIFSEFDVGGAGVPFIVLWLIIGPARRSG